MMELYIGAVYGLALHFLGRWVEYNRKNGYLAPWAYVRLDIAGWISAVVGAGATVELLPEIGPALGLAANKAGAFVLCYMGSSSLAKLPAILSPKMSGDR